MIRGVDKIAYKGRPIRYGLSNIEKGRIRGDLMKIYKIVTGNTMDPLKGMDEETVAVDMGDKFKKNLGEFDYKDTEVVIAKTGVF